MWLVFPRIPQYLLLLTVTFSRYTDLSECVVTALCSLFSFSLLSSPPLCPSMRRHLAAPEDKIHKSNGQVHLHEASSGWHQLGKGGEMGLETKVSSSRLSHTKQVQWEDRQDQLAKESLSCK